MIAAINQKKVYTEVYGVLNSLGDKYIKKVPNDILNSIENNKDENYIIYDMSLPLSKQNISKEAISIICNLHLKYWCINEKEKNIIRNIINKNTIKAEEKKKQIYSSNVFKQEEKENNGRNEITKIEKNKKEEKVLCVIKEKWYEKIIRWINNLGGKRNG